MKILENSKFRLDRKVEEDFRKDTAKEKSGLTDHLIFFEQLLRDVF